MDFTGRMTTLTDTNGSVFAYEFDGEGNRLSQALNDCLSKRFVYDGADVLLELTPANAVAYAWIDGPGIDQPIERLLFIDGAPRARRVFHADALGSVAALTGPDGHVTQTYAYTAFGTLRSSSGPDLNRVTYTAREQLGASQGWMHYRHRVYLSGHGRFTSLDPWGYIGGVNQYLSCGNHPVDVRDPFGLLEDYSLNLTGEKRIWLTNRRVNADGSITRVSYPVFSGKGEHRNDPGSVSVPNAGPIPMGKYYIVDRPLGGIRAKLSIRKKEWFALYYEDDVIDDQMTVGGIMRTNFRLHFGISSEGCITFEFKDQFEKVRELLRETRTAIIPGTDIKYYGILTVYGDEEK